MYASNLRCVSCERTYKLEPLYECPACRDILHVEYDYERIRAEAGVPASAADFAALLPVKPEFVRSLGEGNTPLVQTERLAKRIGVGRLWLKCESGNPTGSFKDRPVSIGVAKALEFGYRRVVIASSGNGAAAAAAYAARAGLSATVLVPESTPDEKVTQTRFYGAEVERVPGPYSNAYAKAKQLAETEPYFNLTTTFINPYTVEGDKTVAFEMFMQLGRTAPDIVFSPIGDGPILVGINRGFRELSRFYPDLRLPRMAGIQAEGCSPIARAFLQGDEQVEAELQPQTIAGGICDGLNGYAKDGTWTLRHIRESGGFSIAVTDEQIAEAQVWLAREGLFVEPSAAASVAGLAQSAAEGRVGPDDTVVAVLTGHGLKDMGQARRTLGIV